MSNKRKISQLSGSMIRRGKKPATVGFVLSAPADGEVPGTPRVAESDAPEARPQEKLSPVPPLRAITRELEAEVRVPSAEDVGKVVPFQAGASAGSAESSPQEARRREAERADEPRPDPDMVTSAQSLVQALREGDIGSAEAIFGRMTGLKPMQVLRVLYSQGGEDLALACRAVGLEQLQFVSIYIMTRKLGLGEEALDPRGLARIVSVFEASDPEEAERTLADWRDKEAS